MSFANGFVKAAKARAAGKAAQTMMSGLQAAGQQRVGDVLKLKPLRDSVSTLGKDYSGKLKELVTTPKGRQAFRHHLTKNLPSLGVAGVYGVAAKKAINAVSSNDQSSQHYQY